MHPALSIIVFTTLSGMGYGLLFWLSVLGSLAFLPLDPAFVIVAFGFSFAAISGGLLSSTIHLGHPERAWRALSQWRSSWLSREGIAALTTYVPAVLLAIVWIVPNAAFHLRGVFALLTAIGAAATVTCTAFIYQSLKPIRAWNNRWVLPNYLALAAMTGALWLNAIGSAFGIDRPIATSIALASVIFSAVIKFGYWHAIDVAPPTSTVGTASGLNMFGQVRSFETPHTSENYLLKEMGFRIARKHAGKLRKIAAICAFALPSAFSVLYLILPGRVGIICTFLAALVATFGVAVERWLFFAEAKHTVTLYYGAASA